MITSTICGYPTYPEPACGNPRSWAPFHDTMGKPAGRYRIVSAWRVQSYIGSHMHQIEVQTLDGKLYTGRGFGGGMFWRGREKAPRRIDLRGKV